MVRAFRVLSYKEGANNTIIPGIPDLQDSCTDFTTSNFAFTASVTREQLRRAKSLQARPCLIGLYFRSQLLPVSWPICASSSW
jgi:hypothetical protein